MLVGEKVQKQITERSSQGGIIKGTVNSKLVQQT